MRGNRRPARDWLRHRRRTGRLGAVGVTRLLTFQVIQVGVFLIVVRGVWAAVLGGLVGVLVVAVTFARWRGRWLTTQVALWWRHRRQRDTGLAHETEGDPRLAALTALVPDLAVEQMPGTDPAGGWGMGSDGAGWFAVLEVDPTDAGVHPPIPLAALAEVAAEAGQAGVVVQVVSHRPAATGGPPQPTLWVTVRLAADTVAESAVDTHDELPDVPAVLAEVARRVGRVLRRRRLHARLLDADAVLDALVRSCDLVPGTAGPGLAAPGREHWRVWQSSRLSHRCFWLRSWPDPEPGTSLLASLNDLPEAQVSIAIALTPRPPHAGADLRCLIRVAAVPDRHRQLCTHAEQLTEQLGGQLFPLDGEQALAVYATAPTGGGGG